MYMDRAEEADAVRRKAEEINQRYAHLMEDEDEDGGAGGGGGGAGGVPRAEFQVLSDFCQIFCLSDFYADFCHDFLPVKIFVEDFLSEF
jgi:hypothetical protein